MRALALATLLAACGGARSPATAPPVNNHAIATPTPAAVEPVLPATPESPSDRIGIDAYEDDSAAAAVPVPGEGAPPPLEQIDTTVTDAEVLAIAPWPTEKKAAKGGEIWVALRSDEKDVLQLSIVEHDRGVVAHYPLGKAARVTGNDTFDGDTYPSRDHTGDYQGPILFAVRVTAPGAGAIDQVVVFGDGTMLRVARRPLGAKDWKAVVAVAFRKGATFMGIGTTDPH